MTERENLVSNITSEGIEEVGYNTSSGLRGVVYVKSEAKVKGKAYYCKNNRRTGRFCRLFR